MYTPFDLAVLCWLIVTNIYAFALFGWDKRCAGRADVSRISELHLVSASACGGWLGGLTGMLFFSHKTRKTSFKLKFGIAFLVWLGLLWVYWTLRRVKG